MVPIHIKVLVALMFLAALAAGVVDQTTGRYVFTTVAMMAAYVSGYGVIWAPPEIPTAVRARAALVAVGALALTATVVWWP